jgi:hypothetical protein
MNIHTEASTPNCVVMLYVCSDTCMFSFGPTQGIGLIQIKNATLYRVRLHRV